MRGGGDRRVPHSLDAVTESCAGGAPSLDEGRPECAIDEVAPLASSWRFSGGS